MPFFIIALVGLIFCTPPAFAATAPCDDRDSIVHKLENSYSESLASIGVVKNGSMVEIFTSEKGTFTVLITTPKGRSCIVITGNSWEGTAPILDGTKI